MLLFEDVAGDVLELSGFLIVDLSFVVVAWKQDSYEAVVLLRSWVVNCDDEVFLFLVVNWAVGNGSVLLSNTTFNSFLTIFNGYTGISLKSSNNFFFVRNVTNILSSL
jgi:hypothetical protein